MNLHRRGQGVAANVVTSEQRVKVPETAARPPGHHDPLIDARLFKGDEVLETDRPDGHGCVPSGNIEEIRQDLRASPVDRHSHVIGLRRPIAVEDERSLDTRAVGGPRSEAAAAGDEYQEGRWYQASHIGFPTGRRVGSCFKITGEFPSTSEKVAVKAGKSAHIPMYRGCAPLPTLGWV